MQKMAIGDPLKLIGKIKDGFIATFLRTLIPTKDIRSEPEYPNGLLSGREILGLFGKNHSGPPLRGSGPLLPGMNV